MTSFRVGLFVVMLAIGGWFSTHAQTQLCSAPKTTPMKLLVSGRRNITGHWISVVTVEHVAQQGGLQEVKKIDPWYVDVEHSTTTCQGGETSANIILTFTAPPARASPGYELFPDLGYYKFHTAAQPWHRARQVCVEEGAHLMIVNSEKEADLLKTLFSRNPKTTGSDETGWLWTGIYEEGTNGNYFTVFGQPATLAVTGYLRWYGGQPDGTGLGDCLLAAGTTAGLNDNPCTKKFCFICEQELF